MTLRLLRHGWVLAFALACGSDGSQSSEPDVAGGQTGEETGPDCAVEQSTRLAWSERSPLGFSADEVLGALGNEHDARLSYDDGSSAALKLTIARDDGAIEYQKRAFEDDGSGAEIAVLECPDVVVVPIVLTFSSSDQAFAEEWALSLLAESRTSATAFSKIDLDELRGNFTVTMVDPARFDDVLAYLTLRLEGDDWSGTLSGTATQMSGSGPDGSVSATGFAIASF